MNKKRIATIVLAVFMSILTGFGLAACGQGNTAEQPQGLRSVNGKLIYGEEEFRGAGVNYFNLFTGIFTRQWDTSGPLSALETLKSYDCKVIRFSTLPFYASEMGYYFETGGVYWEKLDEIVQKCEELGIGLIPSLFWTFSCFDYYGEAYHEAINDDNSRGMQFIRSYTEEFVKRYASSPAIWGWEFSNEKILSADLPDTVGTDSYFSTDDLNRVYTVFANVVRANDPYGRIVSSGDTNPRESQYNQWKSNAWTKDTAEQHREVMEAINPVGIDTVSQHQYSLRSVLDPGDRTSVLFDATTWTSFFEYLMEISSSMGKACYVGEVGYGCDEALGWENVTLDHAARSYGAAADAAYETGMQLILFWNYDPVTNPDPEGQIYSRGTGVEFSWNERMLLGKMVLETMRDLNARYAEAAAAEKNR